VQTVPITTLLTAMAGKSWSTASVGTPDRFAYWHDAVSQAVLNVAPRNPAGERFSGAITCSEFDDLRFAAFVSTPHEIARTRAHINRSKGEHYLISVQRRGTSVMTQADRSCELRAGNIGILDGMRPFTVAFPEEVERTVAVIPHRLLRPRAPWLDAMPLNRLPVGSPLIDVCRVYIERLSAPQGIAPREAWLLADNLCNLVALLTAPGETDRHALRNVRRDVALDLMIAYLRTNLADPMLSPQLLARHMRVSVRTVHNRFEEAGTTFGRWVLEHRLAACHKALGDPLHDRFSVAQIAFGWGFNDLSHFTKAFRARFDCPPGQLRRLRRACVLEKQT
jgi:AraC family transcriptional activator of tynA and feaB